MQLTPRYAAPPALVVDGILDDPREVVLRQRRRLSTILHRLRPADWAAASRCEGWSVQDVVTHLVSTNQFWGLSVAAGLAGQPTTFLATFDPVASPAQLVDGLRSLAPAEVLERYDASTEELAATVAGLDASGLDALAEAPPGHVAVRAVLLHALWDAWVHERDIVLPLGLAATEEDDEVLACLAYVAALGPAFLATTGSTRTGTLAVAATDPTLRVIVQAGSTVVVRQGEVPPDAPTISGRAVDLIEGFSFRAPFAHGLDPDDRWLLGGLGEVFDLT